jgi:hypothetical protein
MLAVMRAEKAAWRDHYRPVFTYSDMVDERIQPQEWGPEDERALSKRTRSEER